MIQTQQEEVSQFLQPYVDGELSDDERMRVTESLESSDSARSYVRTQTEVRDLLRSLSRLEAPNELHARIRGALDEADEAQRDNVAHLSSWRKRIASVSITLLPAAAAAALMFVYVRGEPSDTSELGASARQVVAIPNLEPPSAPPLPLTRTAVRPANLHLPDGVQLVSSNPLQLGTGDPGESLELVDSSDGQHFLLRIRPGDGRTSTGNEIVVSGRRFRRVKTTRHEEAVEFSHGGRIVTISVVQNPSKATAPSTSEADAAFRRLLGIAQSLEIK
jgi:hypothetical protein